MHQEAKQKATGASIQMEIGNQNLAERTLHIINENN